MRLIKIEHFASRRHKYISNRSKVKTLGNTVLKYNKLLQIQIYKSFSNSIHANVTWKNFQPRHMFSVMDCFLLWTSVMNQIEMCEKFTFKLKKTPQNNLFFHRTVNSYKYYLLLFQFPLCLKVASGPAGMRCFISLIALRVHFHCEGHLSVK